MVFASTSTSHPSDIDHEFSLLEHRQEPLLIVLTSFYSACSMQHFMSDDTKDSSFIVSQWAFGSHEGSHEP